MVDERRPLPLVLRDITRDGYLPLIQGGHATWIVRTTRKGHALAVISQRWNAWEDAELLNEPSVDMASVGPSIFFEYRAQQDAATVVDEVRDPC